MKRQTPLRYVPEFDLNSRPQIKESRREGEMGSKRDLELIIRDMLDQYDLGDILEVLAFYIPTRYKKVSE